jgi:azurin
MLVCTVIAAAGMANAAGARAIQTPRNNARMRLAVNDIMVKNYTRETRMKTLNLRHNANRAMSCIGGNSGIPRV